MQVVLRKMLIGGAAAITLGSGVACPGLAQAADTPQAPPSAAAQVSPAQPGEIRWAPALTIHKAHEGPADHAVAYTLWVKNDGTAPTNGIYTVVDSLPDGVTFGSVDAGQRWNCGADALRTVVTCRSDAYLAPGATSDPITVHTGIADKDACQLINIAAVGGGDHQGGGGIGAAPGDRGKGPDGSGIHLAKDVLSLPCHRESDHSGVVVTVNVTGNNNGGRGGNSSGATANGNGHIHDVTGGSAKAGAKAAAEAHATAHATAQSKAHGGRPIINHKHTTHRIHRNVPCHMPLRHFGKRR